MGEEMIDHSKVKALKFVSMETGELDVAQSYIDADGMLIIPLNPDFSLKSNPYCFEVAPGMVQVRSEYRHFGAGKITFLNKETSRAILIRTGFEKLEHAARVICDRSTDYEPGDWSRWNYVGACLISAWEHFSGAWCL